MTFGCSMNAPSSGLRPELVVGGLIICVRPELLGEAVLDAVDVHGCPRPCQISALGGHPDDGGRVSVVREEVLHLHLKGAAAQLEELAEQPEDLVLTFVVTGERARSGDVPD